MEVPMEYMTVQEAAKKWKISERLVQKYCAEGRIDGIRKFGKSWGIPSSAVKPQDPRKEKERPVSQHSRPRPEVFLGFMPLMNTPFEPGRCVDYINEMENGRGKEIALAEYHYFSGRPEKAIQEAELYLTCPDAAYRFSACLIYAYANLSVGQIQLRPLCADRDQEYAGCQYRNAVCPCHRGFCRFCILRASASFRCRKKCPRAGVPAAAAARPAGVCPVCPGTLSLSERGLW